MERKYNRQELEDKKLTELKQILKNRNLKSTGNKSDLIDRILEGEVSYLDILPKDVRDIVGEYQTYNNPNNQLLRYIFEQMTKLINYKKLGHWEHQILKKLNKEQQEEYLFLNNNIEIDMNDYELPNLKPLEDLNIILEIKPYNKQSDSDPDLIITNVTIGKFGSISDEKMIEILIFLDKHFITSEYLNKLFYERNLPFAFAPLINNDPYLNRFKMVYGGKFI